MKDSTMTTVNLDCKDIAALLSGLVDDVVTSQERYAAERHLSECEACRRRLDEAEMLDRLLMSDAAVLEALPKGFEDAVLARTTRAGFVRVSAASRWTAIGGWVAAAASLAIAFGVWIQSGQDAIRGSGESVAATNPPTGSTPSGNNATVRAETPPANARPTYPFIPRGGSMTLDAALPPETYGFDAASVRSDSGESDSVRTISSDVETRARGRDLSRVFERWRSDIWTMSIIGPAGFPGYQSGESTVRLPGLLDRGALKRSTLSPSDAEVLRSATTLLEMLMDADQQTFRDVERIRRIAEDGNLLGRLTDTRSRLAAVDRPAVLAVESIVHRIVYGPVNLSDVALLARTVTDLQLIGQLDTMTGRWDPQSSL